MLRAYLDFDETRALDLFGGTGSISLELVSRGCPQVTTVEKDRQHFSFISQCQRTLGDEAWNPICADALRFISRCAQPYDLVFADPPYALPELPTLPKLILERGLLKPNGIFVFEHGKNNSFEDVPGFIEHRAYAA